MSENETEAAQAWGNIEAGHGLVAVDPEWASSKGLPSTIQHPLDTSKIVYVIEAYHELHCLVSSKKYRRTKRNLKADEHEPVS